MTPSFAMKEITIENLYTPDGLYLNMPEILALGYPYTIIISMRGGGKTYGFLRYALERGERFLYFRRTKPALAVAADRDLHIFREVNRDLDRDVQPSIDLKTGLASFREDGELVAYAASLSTFAGIRSIGSARSVGIEWLVFDECIPQEDERRTYDVYSAWMHAQETLLRNDEITGEKTARRLLMANADKIYGDIIAGYGIGDELLFMQENGIEAAEHSPDVLILRPMCDELRRAKENTSLYRSASGSAFNRVALENSFEIRDRSQIKKQPIGEYVAAVAAGGVCIYRHKSRPAYYVTTRISGKPKTYEGSAAGRKKYLRDNTRIWRAYMEGRVCFEDLTAQMAFFNLYELL